MMDYEYRVIPAPKRLKRRKGVSSSTDLLAQTLTECINAEAVAGWEYVRLEQLAAEEPGGWFRRGRLVEETLMVFRRPRATAHPDASDSGEPRPARLQSRPPLAAPRREPEAPPQHERRPLPPRGSDGTPPLLRPVPRFTPGDRG